MNPNKGQSLIQYIIENAKKKKYKKCTKIRVKRGATREQREIN